MQRLPGNPFPSSISQARVRSESHARGAFDNGRWKDRLQGPQRGPRLEGLFDASRGQDRKAEGDGRETEGPREKGGGKAIKEQRKDCVRMQTDSQGLMRG